MHNVIVSTCALNQWAMDFSGNLERIRLSIAKARKSGARYRVGPELEISGYGCEDHFSELDTFRHSWECIAELISVGDTDDILVDIGAPVMHRGVPYNCRVLILNREVLLVRPKIDLADSGNYREPRWFRAWNKRRPLEQFLLPAVVRRVCTNETPFCSFGQAAIELSDGVTVGCETCEELWTPHATNIDLSLAGIDIIGNGSGSHHVLRKLNARIELLQSATRKGGGVYLYANQVGCDGSRLYYDGSALIVLNGSILRQGSQFTLSTEVDVITTVVDIEDVRSYRASFTSGSVQAASAQQERTIPRLRPKTTFSLSPPRGDDCIIPEEAFMEVLNILPEEEIARGPACWLWDYLRRSGMNGFFLPLSGGADSSSSAAIVGSMCQMIVAAVADPTCEERLLKDVRRVTCTNSEYVPVDARELASRILHTMYMGSGQVSSAETKGRAENLAQEIGARHYNVDIHGIVESFLGVFQTVFKNRRPRYSAHGGTNVENLALQNVQARVRMVLGYLFAQLSLWASGRHGSLLVLGSSNVDEGLRGYLTKYDCSSADINPIGGISKVDLRRFLVWAADSDGLGYSSLVEVVNAPPTAELEPRTEDYTQTDEQDMGMTYAELSWFSRLRKLARCGPYSMYVKLKTTWRKTCSPMDVALKVKYFFRMYSINRHKLTTLTPSYHAEDYSPEDNRFDLRQFLYNVQWPWQFTKIDEDVLGTDEADEALP